MTYPQGLKVRSWIRAKWNGVLMTWKNASICDSLGMPKLSGMIGQRSLGGFFGRMMMADEYDQWDQAYATPITVMCPATGEGIPESEVKIVDISEDIQGFDIVVFECPLCNINHRSKRLG